MSHVALLLRDLPAGGVEIVSLRLAHGLTGRGHRVTLVLMHEAGALRSAVPPEVEVVGLGGIGSLRDHPLDAPRVLARWVRWLARHRPNAVVAAKEQANVLAVVGARAVRDRPRILVTRHVPLDRGGPKARALYSTVLHGADELVAVSQALADELREAVPASARDRVVYRPNAVLASGWRDEAALDPAHPWFVADRTTPTVLAVGRVTHQKGHDVLLDALARLASVGGPSDARLVVLGEGPDTAARIRQAKQLGLGARVHFAGHVDRPLAWMARADVVALPSRWEGLPTVLVEALAVGAPVVATDCSTGPRELLDGGRHGPLVPVDDAQALARALADQLTAPRRPTDFDPTPFTVQAAAAAWEASIRPPASR